MSLFLLNLIFCINITLIVGFITVIERKLLALIQRRVGPNYVGFKGRLQFIADALKLLAKHIIIILRVNKLLFIFFPGCILVLCYLFWINLIWSPHLNNFEIEYNLIFMLVLSSLFSIMLFILGLSSKNKYAILSSFRIVNTTLNLEVLLSFLILYLLLLFESFSFQKIINFQSYFILNIFYLLPITPLIIVVFLVETGRIPFDLNEAESELIGGYTTEFGGFFFALFYLGEYFHLFCFSFTYTLLFFGGWHFILLDAII